MPEILLHESIAIGYFTLQREASPATPTAGAPVNVEIHEGFYTPAAMRPTIQPASRVPPRLTRSRHRALALNSVVAHEDPDQTEDITAIDNHTNFHDNIDDIFTPLQHAYTSAPIRVPPLERWYTVSPPSSDGGHGVPNNHMTPGSFSEALQGRQVLTSQEHIGEQSVDNRRSYALLYGTIRNEYIDDRTNTPMFVVDYGSPWLHYRIAQSLCDVRPLEAQGSVGMSDGNLRGSVPWRGRIELDFGAAIQGQAAAGDGETSGAAGSETVLLGADTPVRNEGGRVVHQFPLPLPARGEWPLVERRIQGYSEDYPATGTDDSTAQKPFPKVTTSFPSYLLFDSNVKESEDSSGDEWIGGEDDWATYDECIDEDDDPVLVTNLHGEVDPPCMHDEPVE